MTFIVFNSQAFSGFHSLWYTFIEELNDFCFSCDAKSLSSSDNLLPEFLNLTYLEFMTSWNGNWENLESLLNSAPHLEMLVFDMVS